MARWNMRSAVAGLLLLAGSGVRAGECSCEHGGVKRVTYVVVEMPEQPPVAAVAPSSSASALPPVVEVPTYVVPTATAEATPVIDYEEPPVHEEVHPENSTHVFTPCSAPGLDRGDLKNLVPAKNVSLYYGAADENDTGSINMTLAFNNPAVILEHVESIETVLCADDTLTVTFATEAGFDEAVEDWSIGEPFILVTSSMGNCSAEFERGFFVVEEVSSDADELTVVVSAHKEDLADIAGELEMSFTSMPAATLTRRLNLNPKYSISFAEGLPGRTTIFSDGQYIDIAAEEAWFESTLTFSGKLKYNFWGFKLQELYFDIDADFAASAAVSASIMAAFSENIRYSPDDLAWSVVDVPGIISLGPGIAFGLGVNVDATAAVGIYAGVDFSLPAGNVHVDFLDGAKTGTSGWEPEYNSYANITQAADVRLDVGADVTVMLQFKLLGGLVDLSSGITASPGFENTFKLRGQQDAAVNGTFKEIHAGIEVPADALECADTNGLEFVSDFVFSVTAFATKWWNHELYSVSVPLVDYCLSF